MKKRVCAAAMTAGLVLTMLAGGPAAPYLVLASEAQEEAQEAEGTQNTDQDQGKEAGKEKEEEKEKEDSQAGLKDREPADSEKAAAADAGKSDAEGAASEKSDEEKAVLEKSDAGKEPSEKPDEGNALQEKSDAESGDTGKAEEENAAPEKADTKEAALNKADQVPEEGENAAPEKAVAEPVEDGTQADPKDSAGQKADSKHIEKTDTGKADPGDIISAGPDFQILDPLPAAAAQESEKVKDVYIDNTVDNSKTYVTGVLKMYVDGELVEETEVYSGEAAVTYSNPRPSQVQGMLDDAYTKVYNLAKQKKALGRNGDVSMDVSELTGKVWDNRKYTTVEDGDAVLIGDSDYLQGAYGVENDDYTRTHIASGDYGKETFLTVTADVTVTSFSITTEKTGSGTVTVTPQKALSGDTVSVKLQADSGWALSTLYIGSGGSEGQITAATYGNSGQTQDSKTFTMPAADVSVSVVFAETASDPEQTETEPEETEPQVTEPEETQPEETEPQVTEPEETQPEETEPQVTEPEEKADQAGETDEVIEEPEESAESKKTTDSKKTGSGKSGSSRSKSPKTGDRGKRAVCLSMSAALVLGLLSWMLRKRERTYR